MPSTFPVEFRIRMSEEEITMFEGCATAVAYEKAIAKVRAARDGAFPADWWETMVDSGRMRRILARWGKR